MKKLSRIQDAKNVSGVYCIKNTKNNKIYVGSSKNIYKRLNAHRSGLRKNYHHNVHLQRSWNKNGEDKFEYYIIKETQDLIQIEQEWIDKTYKENYNLYPIANSPKGLKLTEEHKEKIRKFHKGKITSENTKDEMSMSRKFVKGRGKSKYKGLSFVSRKKLWEVRIRAKRGEPSIYVGGFKNEEEAAHNYDYYALKFHGKENCFLNFPKYDYSNFQPKLNK